MKEISVDRKHVWEHVSPDGDKCEFVVVISNERKYCQFQRYKKEKVTGASGESETWQRDGDPFIIDGPFLLDSADAYRSCTSVIPQNKQSGQNVATILQVPNITDHRKTRSDQIEEQVAESMGNMDGSAKPIYTFTGPELSAEPADYGQFRTGVNVETMPEVEKTPEEWALEKQDEGLKQWQKDAISRKQTHRPLAPPRIGGQVRPQFKAKKVPASEII